LPIFSKAEICGYFGSNILVGIFTAIPWLTSFVGLIVFLEIMIKPENEKAL
jgi:hypothetical protein